MGVKIAVFTATRAEYGLLAPLIIKMRKDSFFDLSVIVTGTHLSRKHGYTIENIEQDGIKVDNKIDLHIDGDTENDICRILGNGISAFSELFGKSKLDGIIVLGDRFELWAVCMAAVIHKVPVIHIHGGELTVGAIDNVVRHSVTKIASIHFASMEEYARRIVQMGEEPERVFTVGALGIDNILNIKPYSVDELTQFTGIDFQSDVALMTYHPVTMDKREAAAGQVEIVLNAVLENKFTTLITMPNMDSGSDLIYQTILKYVERYPTKLYLKKSLGQKAYLSAMKYAKMMIGNSSSGIIESASFRLPVVNIGDRQKGRLKPKNVIDCECKEESIRDAIKAALSGEFKASLGDLINPYGDGNAADKIISNMKKIDFSNKAKLLEKKFYDLKF